MKHNNQIPNGHFHKQWQRRVMTWFDQAGRKKARRTARSLKAARLAPRPLDLLRPAVRCQTVQYNTKLRSGRGFTLAELKASGIAKKVAKTIGIVYDHRRRNRSQESLEMNKVRLSSYMSKLVVLPKKGAVKVEGDLVKSLSNTFSIENEKIVEKARSIESSEQSFKAYATLRKAAGIQRHFGIRAKRAAEKAEELAAKAK
jgi:large subunit ribosomal protein L13e